MKRVAYNEDRLFHFSYRVTRYRLQVLRIVAALAQLVERHFCKVDVLGSSPRGGSSIV